MSSTISHPHDVVPYPVLPEFHQRTTKLLVGNSDLQNARATMADTACSTISLYRRSPDAVNPRASICDYSSVKSSRFCHQLVQVVGGFNCSLVAVNNGTEPDSISMGFGRRASTESHSQYVRCESSNICPNNSRSSSTKLSHVRQIYVVGGSGWRRCSSFSCFASQHQWGGSVERNDAAATGPLVKPDAKLTAEEAVKVQMDALAQNDDPRLDHGLEVLYHFANAEGTLDGGSLSQYFGFASDLYHFGHFALKFKTRYPDLLNHHGYEIISIKEAGNDCEVKVQLHEMGDYWTFSMSKCVRGRLPPCWLTSSLLRHP